MRFGDAEIGEHQGGGFGLHRAAGAMAFLLICVLVSYLKPGFTKFGRIEISHPDYSKVADLRAPGPYTNIEIQRRNRAIHNAKRNIYESSPVIASRIIVGPESH